MCVNTYVCLSPGTGSDELCTDNKECVSGADCFLGRCQCGYFAGRILDDVISGQNGQCGKPCITISSFC